MENAWSSGTDRGRTAEQRGLTLIELVVVLAVLVAIAGLVMPYAGRFIERAHGATGASNIREVTGSLIRYETESMGRQPKRFDALVDATGDLFFGLTDFWSLTGFEDFVVRTPDAGELAALRRVGIDEVVIMPASGDATFFVPDPADVVELDDLQELVFLENSGAAEGGRFVAEELNGDPDGVYVALGVGTSCTAVGRTMATTPLHFSEDLPPAELYGRFLAVYQVGDAAGPLRRARFTGVLCPEPEGMNEHLGAYFDATAR